MTRFVFNAHGFILHAEALSTNGVGTVELVSCTHNGRDVLRWLPKPVRAALAIVVWADGIPVVEVNQ